MAVDEEARAVEAVRGLYDALDALLRGKGTAAMNRVWHHADYVSSSHPYGDWAFGWPEVSATWQEGAAVWGHYRGHADRSDRICNISNLRVKVRGETAYSASVYRSKFYMSDGELDLK